VKSKLNKHQQKNPNIQALSNTHPSTPSWFNTNKKPPVGSTSSFLPGLPIRPNPGSRLDTNKTTKVLSRLREWKSVPNYLLEFAPRFAFSVNWLGRFSVAENSGFFFLERQLGGKRACVKLATWFCVVFFGPFPGEKQKDGKVHIHSRSNTHVQALFFQRSDSWC